MSDSQLVLSLFPGIDLLGRAFTQSGFCVVTGPDLIYGGDIRSFNVPDYRFDGVIGGSPCQGFSSLNRTGDKTESVEMLNEFTRVVYESKPDWYLLENVSRVPSITVPNYYSQRFNLDAAWFSKYTRLRTFQFGHVEDRLLNPPIAPASSKIIYGGAALASDDRTFKELCEIQGLPLGFDLPSFNVAGKKRAVGNGVPMCLGRVVAKLIASVTRRSSNVVAGSAFNRCGCGCGRDVPGNKKTSSDACRKRLSRSREIK